jgi:hypothetical protein
MSPPYTLNDMAHDVLDLMTFLNIESAHLCGASVRNRERGIFCANIYVNWLSAPFRSDTQVEYEERVVSVACRRWAA